MPSLKIVNLNDGVYKILRLGNNLSQLHTISFDGANTSTINFVGLLPNLVDVRLDGSNAVTLIGSENVLWHKVQHLDLGFFRPDWPISVHSAIGSAKIDCLEWNNLPWNGFPKLQSLTLYNMTHSVLYNLACFASFKSMLLTFDVIMTRDELFDFEMLSEFHNLHFISISNTQRYINFEALFTLKLLEKVRIYIMTCSSAQKLMFTESLPNAILLCR